MFGNVGSARNKETEQAACVKFLHEYRQNNLICLTEMWRTETDSDPDLPDFTVYRLDRTVKETDKTKGGGVCVKSRWCTNVTIKESLCCGDIELLSVALHPFYLPREFNQVFLTVVYILSPVAFNLPARSVH